MLFVKQISMSIGYRWHKYWFEYHADSYYWREYISEKEKAQKHLKKATKHMYIKNDLRFRLNQLSS